MPKPSVMVKGGSYPSNGIRDDPVKKSRRALTEAWGRSRSSCQNQATCTWPSPKGTGEGLWGASALITSEAEEEEEEEEEEAEGAG